MAMKFCGWLQLRVRRAYLATICRSCFLNPFAFPFACLIFELLPFVVFFFILELCPELISKTVLAMVMKFCGLIDLIKEECSAHEHQLLLA